MALRTYYDFGIPTTTSTGRCKRSLDVLIANRTLGPADAEELAHLQLLNWYFDDLGDNDLKVTLHVPEQATVLIEVLDSLAVDYHAVPAFDEDDTAAVSATALEYDCDVVLSKVELHPSLTDDSSLVTRDVAGVLREAELHAKGFNAPWSFESPAKYQPWMQFYAMSEHSIFRSLLAEWHESRKASSETAEAMRILVLSLQSVCFSRDRMAFYRQQDRWAHRAGLERQDFRFEYTAYLNHFYFSLYAAVDQVAALVVRAYGLPISDAQIGPLYAAFRRTIKHIPEICPLFTGDDFWKMYRLLRDMRHTSAHRGPLTQQVVYKGDDDFTIEQIDAKAVELGYFDDTAFFTGELRQYTIEMARFRAKLALLGPPIKHVVFVQHEDGSGSLYNPDPHADLQRFLEFFHRVLNAIKPWDRQRIPGSDVLIARWRSDIETVGVHINTVWTVWEHFKIIYATGMGNTDVSQHPSAIYLFLFITKAIVEWVMLGVRRQVDSDARSVSLLNFLKELKEHPTTYGLSNCIETFRSRALQLNPEWQQRYEHEAEVAFSAVADDSGLHMSSKKIATDMKALKKSSSKLVDITNRYIAHTSALEDSPELPVEAIDGSVEQIYALTRKYGRLFDAYGVGPNEIDADSLRDLFSFPWVANEAAATTP